MKIIDIKNVETTITVEFTETELCTLVAGLALTSGPQREGFTKKYNLKSLPYDFHRGDDSLKFYEKLLDICTKNFGGKK